MAVNDIFNKVPVEVPNMSGFDLSHENIFSAKVGTLTPCFVHEMLPKDSISIGVSTQVQLPPMATDFYGRVNAHFEAFFVPNRILFGGWKEFITHSVQSSHPSGTPTTQWSKLLPQLRMLSDDMGPGSLSDYLGCKPATNAVSGQTGITAIPNPLRYLAYHKIWDDWYRDSRIQRSAFEHIEISSSPGASNKFYQIPWVSTGINQNVVVHSDAVCSDGVKAAALRQRNFSRDYFTNATALPQSGTAAAVSFGISNNTGSFTVAALRAANSLQQWLERNNLAGERYSDQIKAQFGIYPADACTDRALYLGRYVTNVYNHSVYQTALGSTASGSVSTQNPFKTQGAKYGQSQAVGNGSIVDRFTASEHGVLMVLFSLVPESTYELGTHRVFGYNNAAHFPFPLLSGVGDQEILNDELGVTRVNADGSPHLCIDPTHGSFGYSQRYSEAKFMMDEVHGLMLDGQSLSAFALKRKLAGSSLGSAFLEIPTTYLDQVAAVSSAVSTYGCWVDAYFSTKKSSTLPAYSIPTLGDMKNTHTEVIPNGGTRL